jgi:hypothetical protein
MKKDTYDIINNYCTSKYKGVLIQPERDYVLRKFLDSYYESIDRFTETHKCPPTSEEEQTIIDSLLNESTLLSYIETSKNYYEKFRYNIENDVKKKMDKPAFLKNILTSILANLIYSVILIILFFVAKDQITTWLTQLTS